MQKDEVLKADDVAMQANLYRWNAHPMNVYAIRKINIARMAVLLRHRARREIEKTLWERKWIRYFNLIKGESLPSEAFS